MKGIIAVLVLATIIVSGSNAINLKSGECISVGNSTFNIQYCAPQACSANITLGQNSTYINQTDSCALNITTTPQDICTINTVMGLNSTYSSNSSACNVTIKTPEYSCPAFPVQPKCAINTTLIAKENETVNFTQSDNLCDLFVNIEPVPICPTFRVLQTHSLIENTALSQFGEMAGNYSDITEKAINLGQEKERFELESKEKQKVIDSVCNVNDTYLYEGWKKLSKSDKKSLHVFISQNGTVDLVSFSQILHPELESEEIRNNHNLGAKLLLESYFSSKFAKDVCEIILYKGTNYTSCGYYPLINQPCIERAQYLEKLETESNASGKINATMISAVIVFLMFVAIILYLHWGSLPPLR